MAHDSWIRNVGRDQQDNTSVPCGISGAHLVFFSKYTGRLDGTKGPHPRGWHLCRHSQKTEVSCTPLTLHAVLAPFHMVGLLIWQLKVPRANLLRGSGRSCKAANDLALQCQNATSTTFCQSVMKASPGRRRREDSTSQWEDTKQFGITFNLTQSLSGTHTTDQIICSLFIGVHWADHIVWKEQSHGQLALSKSLVQTRLFRATKF